MTVTISSALVDRLVSLAAATPGREVCGLLHGTRQRVAAIEVAANVSPEPEDSFELDPVVLFAALRRQRTGGATVIGHFHSHPHGPARPSSRDADAAREHGMLWLIVGGGEVTGWRAIAGGRIEGAFEPVALLVEG